MLEVATHVDHPITAAEVPASECVSYVLNRFAKNRATFELFLRTYTLELCPEIKRAQWRYFETSNGAVFMVPVGQDSLLVSIDVNGFEARVSAEVAGLIVSLYVLSRVALLSRDQEHMRMVVMLRNYAMQHPKAATIYRAID